MREAILSGVNNMTRDVRPGKDYMETDSREAHQTNGLFKISW